MYENVSSAKNNLRLAQGDSSLSLHKNLTFNILCLDQTEGQERPSSDAITMCLKTLKKDSQGVLKKHLRCKEKGWSMHRPQEFWVADHHLDVHLQGKDKKKILKLFYF